MTKFQMLTALLDELANKIAEADAEQSIDDFQCGVIEGKLAAYKEIARGLAKMIEAFPATAGINRYDD
jgi:hypothetical protein